MRYPVRTDFFTLPYQQHRDPSYGELCWQVFTSLTMGAKGESRHDIAGIWVAFFSRAISLRTGILYFTYWCAATHPPSCCLPESVDEPEGCCGCRDDPSNQIYPYGNGVITRRAKPGTFNISSPGGDQTSDGLGQPQDYVKGPHYYDAKSINSIVLAFGKLLLGATSTAVFHPGGPPGSHPPPVPKNITGCMVTSLQSDPDPSGARGHFLIGQFVLEDGRTAVLVHNQDPYVTQWATITFEAKLNQPTEAAGVLEVDPVHGTEAELLDDSPLHAGVQMGLRPGMARFLIAQPVAVAGSLLE